MQIPVNALVPVTAKLPLSWTFENTAPDEQAILRTETFPVYNDRNGAPVDPRSYVLPVEQMILPPMVIVPVVDIPPAETFPVYTDRNGAPVDPRSYVLPVEQMIEPVIVPPDVLSLAESKLLLLVLL